MVFSFERRIPGGLDAGLPPFGTRILEHEVRREDSGMVHKWEGPETKGPTKTEKVRSTP
jgi:hypothetical protein